MSAATVISTLLGVVMSNELSIIAICIVYNYIPFSYLRQGGHVFIGVCLFFCLSVNGMTQKPPIRNSWNFTEWLNTIQELIDHIF